MFMSTTARVSIIQLTPTSAKYCPRELYWNRTHCPETYIYRKHLSALYQAGAEFSSLCYLSPLFVSNCLDLNDSENPCRLLISSISPLIVGLRREELGVYYRKLAHIRSCSTWITATVLKAQRLPRFRYRFRLRHTQSRSHHGITIEKCIDVGE